MPHNMDEALDVLVSPPSTPKPTKSGGAIRAKSRSGSFGPASFGPASSRSMYDSFDYAPSSTHLGVVTEDLELEKDMLPMHCTGSDPDHSMKFPLVSQRITRARALGLQTRHYHALMAKDALDEDMDAPLSPLGPPCSSELRNMANLEVKDIFALARTSGWLVAWTGSSGAEKFLGQRLNQVPSEKLEVPKDIEAVLVLSTVGTCAQCQELVQSLRAGGDGGAAIIGILTDAGIGADFEETIQAQQSLFACGVDDVILNSSHKSELKLSVGLSLGRRREQQLAAKTMRSKLRLEFDKQLEEQARVLSDTESPIGLFWQAIHRTFQGFPRIRPELEEDPAEDTTVGPCVLGPKLGHGTFGKVHMAEDMRTGELEAIKVISKENLTELHHVRSVWNEMDFLSRLNHENIVGLRGALHGPFHVFIRMELAGGCNLFAALRMTGGRFSREGARKIQSQLALAIEHCHAAGIAHRDLKPENLALDDSLIQLKVLDFGSGAPTCQKSCGFVGTYPFMAPEVLASEEAEDEARYYDAAPVDVWACGVILLEMLCGIGKLNKMLGWPKKAEPCARQAKELLEYFSVPGRAAAAIDRGEPDGQLTALLEGMLRVQAGERSSAPEIVRSAWFAEP